MLCETLVLHCGVALRTVADVPGILLSPIFKLACILLILKDLIVIDVLHPRVALHTVVEFHAFCFPRQIEIVLYS